MKITQIVILALLIVSCSKEKKKCWLCVGETRLQPKNGGNPSHVSGSPSEVHCKLTQDGIMNYMASRRTEVSYNDTMNEVFDLDCIEQK